MPPKTLLLLVSIACVAIAAGAQSANSCGDLVNLKIDHVEITKTAEVPAGTTVPPPFPGLPSIGPLPVHCRVDGVINRRKGVGGEEFGIGFAVSLPAKEAWNGDFMMQGGGGGNGVVAYPSAHPCGRQTGADARVRSRQHGYRTQGEDWSIRLLVHARSAGFSGLCLSC